MDYLNSLLQILSTVLIFITLFIAFYYIIINLIGVPYVPTRKKQLQKMIEVADLQNEDIVYDLGSGDGRIVIEAAKKGVKAAVGFERNPLLTIFSKIRSKFNKLSNTYFYTQSLWNSDLSKPNKIFVYLLSSTMIKLEEKIKSEGKDGLIIISNTFKFKTLELVESYEKENIFVYKLKK